MKRRDFLRTSMTAAGAALIANRLPGQAVSPVTQPATARFSARLEKGGGPGPSIFQVFDNLNAFDQAIRTYNAILLELVAVDIYQSGGTIYFLGAWNHQALPTRFIAASSFRAFNDTFLAQRSQGYGLIDLNVTTIDGGPFFAGIFQSSSLQQVLLSDITADNLYPEIQGYQKENPDMQLIRIQGYASSPALTSQMLYTVLFQAGSTSSNGFLSEDWSSFYDYFNADSGKNNLLSLSVVPMKGQYKVAAAYLPGDNSIFLLNQPWTTFLTNVDTMTVTQGYHVKSLEVHLIPENWGAAIDAAFGPTSVGYTYGISTGNETSIVARGYAVKDTLRMDQGVPLTLASVSKFLDAVALFLALQEAGISVNAPFLPLIRDYLPRGTVPAPRVNLITIRDLLTHSAGLDEAGGPNYDGVLWDFIAEYVSQPLNPQKTDPAGNPGTVVFYSNSAYQTIRGIVWALTRAQTYHDWVRTRLLVPLEMGETSMPGPPSSSPANYYQRDWTTPSSGPIIGDDASWDSTPDDMLKLLAAVRTNFPLKDRGAQLFTQYPFQYQFDNDNHTRIVSPCRVAPGFDPINVSAVNSAPLPYWTKSGGYANYAQSRIFHMDNPRLDVVLQTNTDTDTLPGSNHGDAISLNTGTMFMNTYYLLYK